MVSLSVKRQERLVFVDPEDDSCAFWWPALIVPEEELEPFRATMDSDIQSIGPDEQLVCYFEDASFSVVPRTALLPFCPDSEPYTLYAKTLRRFFTDAAILRATAYWNTGEIPVGFKWLSVISDGVTAGASRKRSFVEEAEAAPQLGSEDEIIDPLTNSHPVASPPPAPAKKPAPTTTKKKKTLTRPKKEEAMPTTAVQTSTRRSSITEVPEGKKSEGEDKNVPPTPPFKPIAELMPTIGHLLPRPLGFNLK